VHHVVRDREDWDLAVHREYSEEGCCALRVVKLVHGRTVTQQKSRINGQILFQIRTSAKGSKLPAEAIQHIWNRRHRLRRCVRTYTAHDKDSSDLKKKLECVKNANGAVQNC
jgi:hypothetical protein